MFLCFLIVLGIPCAFSLYDASSPSGEEYFPTNDWSDTFDWKLLKAYSTPNYRNVLISPIGLKLVLALLYEGSGGITEKEFQNLLQFPMDKKNMRDNFEAILRGLQLNEKRDYLLNLGTRVFLDSRLEAQQLFTAKALTSYQTEIQAINFSRPQEASQTINFWVKALTNEPKSQLIAPGDLQDAIMIVANAIYFKGTWRHQFSKKNTVVGDFYLSTNEVVKAPYMTTIDAFYYFHSNELDAKILRLPYKGQRYALFIVLPNSKTGLQDLIKKINLHVLKKQLHFMDKVPVQVTLPKFKFDFQAKFMKTLKDFGLRQMFENTASFPGIARGSSPHLLSKLLVSDIVQKAGIEIDEEGSFAYSATEVPTGNKSAKVDYVCNVIHPFMFFLEEQTSGTILFVGKMENPVGRAAVPMPQYFGDNQGSQAVPSVDVPNLQPSNPERDMIKRRFDYFDLELMKEFSELPGNVFLSPASIKTTLALILEGARGRSATEIERALRIDNVEQPEIRQILARLVTDLKGGTDETVLKSANALFVSNKYNVFPEYRKKVKKYYEGDLQAVDFANMNVAKSINAWTSSYTMGLINNVVGTGLHPDTALVGASALFFKGKWKTAFNPNSTKNEYFRSPTRGFVKVSMMQLSHSFNYNYNIDLNAHAVELPYQDNVYTMLVLIPGNETNVKTLAKDMQHSQLNIVIDALRQTDLLLELPKFNIDYQTDLADFLRPLGVNEIFTSRANLSGMSPEKIKINNIFHKTRIEVTEQGTEAAAIDSLVVSSAKKIRVKEPFLFFIYHKDSRNIIFQGLFAEPVQISTRPKTSTHHGTKTTPSPVELSDERGL